MRPLCLVLLSGALPGEARAAAAEALRNRGFEVFAERPICKAGAFPAPFATDGWAIVGYNVLMEQGSYRAGSVFGEAETERAAHLLAHVIPDPARHLRIAEDARLAEELARRLLGDDELAALDREIAERRRDMATDLPVLCDLSRFRYRAKVERVSWQGRTAVKKTFRRTGRDAMRRELAFHDAVAPDSDCPARVLARSENAILYEDIDNRLRVRRIFGRRLPLPLPLARVRELAEFVRLVAAKGWDPIDLTPRDNVLIDARTGRLRAIDFEFAHRRAAPVAPEASYFLSGVPQGVEVAMPLNQPMDEDPYPAKWRPFTGLSKASFLHDPAWLQVCKRWLVHPVWLAAFAGRSWWRRRRYARQRDDVLSRIVLRRGEIGEAGRP